MQVFQAENKFHSKNFLFQSKRNVYGLYRYIPKMTENKIKKDYDDPFERSYGRFYFFE